MPVNTYLSFAAAFFLLASPIFLGSWVFTWIRLRRSRKETEKTVALIRDRYAPIISQEEEVERLKSIAATEAAALEAFRSESEREIRDIESSISQTRSTYAEKRRILSRLEQQMAVYDESLAFAELGVYEPHFDFTDSEAFKNAIKGVRDKQKRLISNKEAAICRTEWTVGNSSSQGQTMVNRQVRLTLRAFNNECEAAIANVRWNNINAMEKRILSAQKAIDKENKSLQIELTQKFVDLRINELRLTHEYREKQKSEKEERAEMARAEREEKKLIADAERAEREERKYQDMLDKARREAVGKDSDALRQKIAALEADLIAAHAASERARAMAELTTSGYVYIISNAGSFGEDVVKIGLTRRLDPDDRVRELGDASVPFTFDTHAMIYSETAPALEGALHREFADRRINAVNMRKEFFRVGLDEVEGAVARLAPDASFFKDREAQEWHETMARRNAFLLDMQAHKESMLPESI